MKQLFSMFMSFTLIFTAFSAQSQTDHQTLLQSVKQSREQERQHIAQREAKFLKEKQNQAAVLAKAKAEFERYQQENNPLKQQTEQNLKEIDALKAQIEQRKSEMGDFESVLNQMSRDFAEVIKHSPTSMQRPQRAAKLDELANPNALLNLDRIELLWLTVQEEMTLAGEFRQFTAPIIEQDGTVSEQTIQQFGGFSSYQNGAFLRYVPETQELLSMADNGQESTANHAFFTGSERFNLLYVDPTGGTLLGILDWAPDWRDRLEQGSIIGQIILVLGALGVLITLWRMLILGWQSHLLKKQLRNLQRPNLNNPLGRILLKMKEHTSVFSGAALSADSKQIQALQLHMDEAVLNEVGSLERGQNLLKLLAATAPLLGLLGTVTGMIITFQSISFFGSGDPKLMAGGISQALITTVLGLIVAIPLLFGHSFISSLSDNILRRLEEQSAGLLAQSVTPDLNSNEES